MDTKRGTDVFRGSLLTLTTALVTCCMWSCSASTIQMDTGAGASARWHAGCLTNGDFSTRVDGPIYASEPSHLAKLVAMGRDAVPVLVELLSSDVATPYIYTDKLVFSPQHLAGTANVHKATVADLADWGLRSIYGVDVGFRSHLPPATKRGGIRKWTKIAATKPPRASTH